MINLNPNPFLDAEIRHVTGFEQGPQKTNQNNKTRIRNEHEN